MMDFLREIRAPNVIIVYHAHCLDGLFAGWAAAEWVEHWTLGGADRLASSREARYGEAPPLAERTHLIVVDFSYPPEALAVLPEGCHVTILDHHDTAAKQWAGVSGSEETAKRVLVERGNVTVYIDQTRSGAGLAYETFMRGANSGRKGDDAMRLLSLAVEDRDLWKFKREHTREYCRALKEITAGAKPENLYVTVDRFPLSAIQALGRSLMAADEKEIAHLRKSRGALLPGDNVLHHRPVPMINYMGPVLSELLNVAADASESRMAAAYVIEKDRVTFSLRSSKDGPNVALIAEKWGGGGHEHAAGFRISLAQFSNLFLRHFTHEQ